MLAEDIVSLLELLLEAHMVLEQVENLRVVHLKKHAGKLACNLGIAGGNEGVEVVSEDLLLALRLGGGEERGQLLGGDRCLCGVGKYTRMRTRTNHLLGWGSRLSHLGVASLVAVASRGTATEALGSTLATHMSE